MVSWMKAQRNGREGDERWPTDDGDGETTGKFGYN
jgi:hypothetical protein